MKKKQIFDSSKYVEGTKCVINSGTEEMDVKIIDIHESGVYAYNSYYRFLVLKKHKEDFVKLVYCEDETFRLNDKFKLYAYVEDVNFWVNIYVNIVTGKVTSGKGKYHSEEDASKNINIPQNCRYVSTILCE